MQYGSRPKETLPVVQTLFDIFRNRRLGYSSRLAAAFSAPLYRGVTFIQRHRLAPKYSSADSELEAAEIEPFVRRQHALGHTAPSRNHRNAFFIARHHIPQNTLAGEAHRGAVELIKQQDMLVEPQSSPPRLPLRYDGNGFVDQEEADFTPSEAASSSRLHFRSSDALRYPAVPDIPRYQDRKSSSGRRRKYCPSSRRR